MPRKPVLVKTVHKALHRLSRIMLNTAFFDQIQIQLEYGNFIQGKCVLSKLQIQHQSTYCANIVFVSFA